MLDFDNWRLLIVTFFPCLAFGGGESVMFLSFYESKVVFLGSACVRDCEVLFLVLRS